jgi:hypothetical protein
MKTINSGSILGALFGAVTNTPAATLRLGAETAVLYGDHIRVEKYGDQSNISSWENTEALVAWEKAAFAAPQSRMLAALFTCLAGATIATESNGPPLVRLPERAEWRSRSDNVMSRASHPVGEAVRVTSEFIDAKISLNYPGFEGLSLDSLGKEHFPLVPVNPRPATPSRPVVATRRGDRVEYRGLGATNSDPPCWAIEIGRKEIHLESNWSAEHPPDSLVFTANPSSCHVTLLGLMGRDGAVQLPAIMHLPDQGSFRISTEPEGIGTLGYDAASDKEKFVKFTFSGATREKPRIKYHWEVVAIHPTISSAAADARFDGFRRNWLNIFQLNPRRRVLANHAASDTCAFCYYEYADMARFTPPLANGLSAGDMIRQTLDAVFSGTSAYGMPGHGAFPDFSADTYPSLLIAAEDYVQGSQDFSWLAKNYSSLKSWADKMLATDRNGDGLVEYVLTGNSGSWTNNKSGYRPANWWDTIGFGHDDAYANALTYRALRGMEGLSRRLKHAEDEVSYHGAADRLRAAYFNAFYNPATGILAGWRSADGQLHDYYFLWVNGIAIHYGLVPMDRANGIMDRLLAKLKDVGYTRFDLGLPGNLIPVKKADYFTNRHRWGGSQNEDGSDGFQIYENGGATACFAYFTLAALYDLGRLEDADRILFPMLDSFAKGNFQGCGSDGKTKDWKTWEGDCWGYEGFLVDNYYTLLAVLDREAAIQRGCKPMKVLEK